MADSIQLPQDIAKIDVVLKYNPDLLRKTFVDILTKLKELEDRIVVLEEAP